MEYFVLANICAGSLSKQKDWILHDSIQTISGLGCSRLNKGCMLILPEAYGQLTLKLPAACAPDYEAGKI